MSDFSRMMELAMAANKAATQEALGVPKAEDDAAKKPASGAAREEHPAQRETTRRS